MCHCLFVCVIQYCMYVHMHVHIYACIQMCVNVCIYPRMSVCGCLQVFERSSKAGHFPSPTTYTELLNKFVLPSPSVAPVLQTECDVPQIHLLSLELEPRLHHGCPPNCCDRFSWLPYNVSLQVLSFLDPGKSLKHID